MNVFSRHATALLLCGASWAAMIPATAAQAQAANASPAAATSPQASGNGGAAAPSQINTGGAGTTVQEIVVTGTRASLDRALAVKKDTIGIVDAISAESIGKFPDQNVAESLQHVPGVSIDRSAGEGKFVTVRGFGPEFNTVLLNNRLLATDSGGREFDFQVLPSDLITSAEVYKSATADQQDGGIGSTIILRTARPLDRQGLHGSFSAGDDFDGTTNKGAPVVSGVISDTNADDTFGVLASFNYDKLVSHFENVSTSGWISQPTAGWLSPSQLQGAAPGMSQVYLPRALDYTSEYNTRERIGGTLAVDWKVSDTLKLQFDALYSQLNVKSWTNQVGWWTNPGDIQNATVNGEGTVTGWTLKPTNGLHTDNILFNSPEKSKTFQLGVNGRWTPRQGTSVEADLSYSRARNVVNQVFDVIGEPNTGATPTFKLNPGGIPTYSGLLPTFDPNNAYLHCCSERGGGPTDSVWQMRLDGKQDLNWGVFSDLKFGLLGTKRDHYNLSIGSPGILGCFYCGYYAQVMPGGMQFHSVNPGSILGAPAVTWLGYGHTSLVQYEGSAAALSQYNPQTRGSSYDPNAVAEYQAVYAADNNSTGPTYNASGSGGVRELTGAIYAQAELKGDLFGHRWNSVLGGRYVYTDTNATGYSVTIAKISMNPGDPTAAQATFTPPIPVTDKNHYGYFLPSGTVRLDWSSKLDVRAAISRTLTRPTLSQLTVGQNFNFRPPAQSTISSGNPGLKPYLAWNYDLAVDYYLGQTSYVSLAGFYKEISNFVSTATLPETIMGELFNVTEPLNANTSTVYGLEGTFQYTFDKLLPAPFDGLGTSLNYTKVDSTTSFNPALTAQVFNVEGLSDSANAILFYEKGPIQVRFAYNWRAPFLQYTFGPNGQPQNVDSYGQIDLQGSYKLTPYMSVFAQVVNLTDAHERYYSSYTDRLMELDETGRRMTFGVRASF
jgi:iron complex outermembrane recepter protein